VFGERGLAAARLEDVAKRAGLSKGTIYLYFPNKEELFREMVRHSVVSAIEEREQRISAAAGSASEVLTEYLRSYWKFIRSEQFAPLFRLIHAEIHNFPDLARFYAEEVVARSHRLLGNLIARGIESGEFRRVDPYVAARIRASLRSAQVCPLHERYSSSIRPHWRGARGRRGLACLCRSLHVGAGAGAAPAHAR
jgi:AcrR family transcriptional regulator